MRLVNVIRQLGSGIKDLISSRHSIAITKGTGIVDPILFDGSSVRSTVMTVQTLHRGQDFVAAWTDAKWGLGQVFIITLFGVVFADLVITAVALFRGGLLGRRRIIIGHFCYFLFLVMRVLRRTSVGIHF